MKHKIFEKTYSEYRFNSKKTIAKWLKVHLKEKILGILKMKDYV